MIKLDRDGLSLCKIQGELFEKSITNVTTSSSIFIRRFMNSMVAKEFDSKDFLNETTSINDIYRSLEEEFGKSEYGSIKFNSEVMFWIGYIYRYFSYTYNLSSKQVYKIIKPNELNELSFKNTYCTPRLVAAKLCLHCSSVIKPSINSSIISNILLSAIGAII